MRQKKSPEMSETKQRRQTAGAEQPQHWYRRMTGVGRWPAQQEYQVSSDADSNLHFQQPGRGGGRYMGSINVIITSGGADAVAYITQNAAIVHDRYIREVSESCPSSHQHRAVIGIPMIPASSASPTHRNGIVGRAILRVNEIFRRNFSFAGENKSVRLAKSSAKT